MKTVSVKQIQELDRMAIEEYGIPSIVLMENAGRSVAEEVILQVSGMSKPAAAIVCGLGNNAGDGFVVARHLINAGMTTKIFLVGQGSQLKHDAAVNYQILKKLDYFIQKISDFEKLNLENVDVIVDAVFGVGLNRNVEGLFKDVIEKINAVHKKVVAVDVPSGLNADTGDIYGVCVKADLTVTFSFAKNGFVKNQGSKYVGTVKIVDIGIPEKLKNVCDK